MGLADEHRELAKFVRLERQRDAIHPHMEEAMPALVHGQLRAPGQRFRFRMPMHGGPLSWRRAARYQSYPSDPMKLMPGLE